MKVVARGKEREVFSVISTPDKTLFFLCESENDVGVRGIMRGDSHFTLVRFFSEPPKSTKVEWFAEKEVELVVNELATGLKEEQKEEQKEDFLFPEL